MKYKIPVFWQMSADIVIEADSLNDAMEEASTAPLPEGDYVPGSFEVDANLAVSLNPE